MKPVFKLAAGLLGIGGVVAGALAITHAFNITPVSSVAKVLSNKPEEKLLSVRWEDLRPDGATTFIPSHATPNFSHAMTPSNGSTDFGINNGSTTKMEGAQKAFNELLNDTAGGPVQDLDGKRIALAGYMTPLNVENNKTRSFLLVPYVGACIHVPAPPSNQIILVETAEPIELKDMWEPFVAIGTVSVQTINTDLAEVGYTMSLERIEAYKEPEGS